MLDPIFFILLLIEPGFCFFLIFGVVHGGHLKLVFFHCFLLKSSRLLFAQRLLLEAGKHGCFGCKIDRRLIIILIHLRNVEGDEFGRGASLVLDKTCIVQILSGLGYLVLGSLLVFGLHLLHVL